MWRDRLLLICLLLSAGCRGSGLITLIVSGLSSASESLRVAVTLDGAPAVRTEVFARARGPLSPVGLRLPPGSSGRLDLDVEGLAAGCVDLRGRTSLTVSADADQEASLGLKALASRRCTCTEDGWCWENRLPHGSLRSIHGLSTADIWVVGDSGALLHWNGLDWSAHASPSTADLLAVYGVHGNDIWAVGKGGLMLHYDGLSWTRGPRITDVDLYAISGSGPQDLWAVGDQGTVLRNDGSGWRASAAPTAVNLRGVLARSPRDVWIIGGRDQVLRYDGDGWRSEVTGQTSRGRLLFITGLFDRAHVWIGGEHETLWQWDGALWSSVPLPPDEVFPDFHYTAGFATSQRGLWVCAGMQNLPDLRLWDGSAWSFTNFRVLQPFNGLWGTNANDMWVIGDGGLLARLSDRNEWVRFDDGTTESLITSLWGSGPSDIWALSSGLSEDGGLLHFNGSLWSVTPLPDGVSSPFSGLWGSGPRDVWAVGHLGEILHFDGVRWSFAQGPNPKGVVGALRAVWGSSASDVWAVGTVIQHYDGKRWSLVWRDVDLRDSLAAVWGSGPTDVWTVGTDGLALHFDGHAWTRLSITTDSLYAIWGSAANDVWFAGDTRGTLYHWDGRRFGAVDVSGQARDPIYGLWGAGARDIYAVGGVELFTEERSRSTVLRYDGSAWTREPHHGPTFLQAVWGSGPNDVWAGGQGGTLMRRRP